MRQIAGITEALHPPTKGVGGRDRVSVAAPVEGSATYPGGPSRPLDLRDGSLGLPAAGTTGLVGMLRYDSAEVARRIAAEYAVPVERVRAEVDEFVHDLLPAAMIDATARRDRRGRRLRDRLAAWSFSAARLVKRTFRPLPTKVRLWMLLTTTRLSHLAFGWGQTVEVLAGLFPRTTGPRATEDWGSAVERIDTVIRDLAARHPLSLECPERALCCWALLRSEGWPADLVVGVDLFPSLGRCWCESGPWTLGGDHRVRERFVPVVRYF